MLKFFSILASFLIVVGAIGSFLTYSKEINAMDVSKSVAVAKVDSIKISTISTDVKIIRSNTAKEATVKLTGDAKASQQPNLSVEVKDRELVIETEPSSGNKWFNVEFNFYSPTMELLVILPEKYFENLEIDTVSGDVVASDVEAANSVISSVSGDITVDNNVKEISIDTDSGDVALITPRITDDIDITTLSGDVDIKVAIEPTDVSFSIDTLSGDVNLFDKYAEDAKLGNGSTQVTIETTSGDIEVTSNQ